MGLRERNVALLAELEVQKLEIARRNGSGSDSGNGEAAAQYDGMSSTARISGLLSAGDKDVLMRQIDSLKEVRKQRHRGTSWQGWGAMAVDCWSKAWSATRQAAAAYGTGGSFMPLLCCLCPCRPVQRLRCCGSSATICKTSCKDVKHS